MSSSWHREALRSGRDSVSQQCVEVDGQGRLTWKVLAVLVLFEVAAAAQVDRGGHGVGGDRRSEVCSRRRDHDVIQERTVGTWFVRKCGTTDITSCDTRYRPVTEIGGMSATGVYWTIPRWWPDLEVASVTFP